MVKINCIYTILPPLYFSVLYSAYSWHRGKFDPTLDESGRRVTIVWQSLHGTNICGTN